MEEHLPVWTFTRGADRLEISREQVDDGTMLIVAGDGTPRSYFFRELNRLDVFQRDMETLLLKTGWGFAGFKPNKRRGRDRRGWPRKANDRRRWWTDGADSPRQPTLKADTTVTPERKKDTAPSGGSTSRTK